MRLNSRHNQTLIALVIISSSGIFSSVPAAYSQSPFPEIGTYHNSQYNFQVTFARGWTGVPVEQGSLVYITAYSPSSFYDGITLKISPDSKVMYRDLQSELGSASTQNGISIPVKDESGNIIEYAMFGGEATKVKSITINGFTWLTRGATSIEAFTDSGGSASGVVAVTDLGSFALQLGATGSTNWEDLLQVMASLSTGSPTPPPPTPDPAPTVVLGNPSEFSKGVYLVNFRTDAQSVDSSILVMTPNRNASLFSLIYPTKSLAFIIEPRSLSVSSSDDVTIILGDVLKAPYTVFVDEKPYEQAILTPAHTQMGSDGQQYKVPDAVTISSLPPGFYNVRIIGTEVVPEFPAGALILITTAVGIVAVLARIKVIG